VQSTFALAAQHNEGIRPYLSRVADDLNPLRVQALFEAIPDEDVGVSGMSDFRVTSVTGQDHT
jgi:hypothetical protein